MATKVHMEALSPTMEEGQVVRWIKAEGDPVASGDILAEIETDKATMELVARGDGTLRKILVEEGGTVPVGEVIGIIAAPDEDIDGMVGPATAAATVPESAPAPPPQEAEEEAEEEAEPAAAREGQATVVAEGRVKASPVARRLANERGLDLGGLTGSGPGGRIVKRDVESAPVGGTDRATMPQVGDLETEFVDVPLTQMRKAIARRLTESLGPVPHFFLTIDVDMTRTVAARRRINAILERDGLKVSINDVIIRATAAALRRHPDCNAWWQGDFVRRFNRVHIGVAVAIDDGLITPVIRDAHAKGVAQISQEVRELAGRAREKRLKPDEYMGSTFSISNLGMFGIEEFTAVINPPEAGILAIGAMEDRAIVEDGQVVVGPRMRVTMSCDHRVIDGAQGSRFLQTLKAYLEEPAAILI